MPNKIELSNPESVITRKAQLIQRETHNSSACLEAQ